MLPIHPFCPASVKQRMSPGNKWLVLLSGKPELFIVINDDPDVPALTPALYESLELPKVTDVAVNAASTFSGAIKDIKPKTTTKRRLGKRIVRL